MGGTAAARSPRRRRRPRYANLPVRGKVLIPFLSLFGVGWFIVTLVLGSSLEARLYEQARTSLNDLAGVTEQNLHNLNVSLGQQASLLASDPDLAHAAAVADRPRLSLIISGVWWTRPPYLLEIIDTRGRPLAWILPKAVLQEPPPDLLPVIDELGGRSVAGVFTTRGDAAAYLVGSAPLEDDGRPAGTLVLVDILDDQLLGSICPSPNKELAVVGGDHAIASTLPLRASDIARLRPNEAGTVAGDGGDYLVETVAVEQSAGSRSLHVLAAVPHSRIQEATRTSWLWAWLIFAAGILVAVVIALLVASGISRPLRELTEVTGRLRTGDLEARSRLRSKDEIGTLAAGFNAMADQLVQRADQLDRAFQEMRQLSETDGLTGLLNRRMLERVIDDEVARGRRHGVRFSLIMIDIDDFKYLNDTYGHPAGDVVLRAVAALVARMTRASDKVGRYGGDEFMIVLPETGIEDAGTVAEKLRQAQALEPYPAPDGQSIPIRLSFGIAAFPASAEDPNELVAHADANLYASKRRGGDTITSEADEDEAEEMSSFGMLDSLVTAVDNKDSYTRRHSEEVTAYALAIARTMNLSPATCDRLRIAGLLHDVGKIGIPDRILRKPGRLSNDELEVIRQHAVLGARIIMDIPNVEEIRAAVVSHHEHYDGTGYPQRLRSQDIPLLGRILAVADAYSAITSDRPYHTGKPQEDAIEEILAGAGSHFDPAVVDAFVASLREHDTADIRLAAPALRGRPRAQGR